MMKSMDKPRIQVDFNELVQSDVVLLSKTDLVVDSAGVGILLTEGLPVFVYEYNHYADGTEEYLLADGIAELNNTAFNGEWSKAAKWCRRINEYGVRKETL
jgi:hypothetical protein